MNYWITFVFLSIVTAWFFINTGYFIFYPISYKIECEFNKWIKIANMVVIFSYSIFVSNALFNHYDPKMLELGYLTIFIISTLMLLNLILTLNPI